MAHPGGRFQKFGTGFWTLYSTQLKPYRCASQEMYVARQMADLYSLVDKQDRIFKYWREERSSKLTT
jgi:hypothetical protein